MPWSEKIYTKGSWGMQGVCFIKGRGKQESGVLDRCQPLAQNKANYIKVWGGHRALGRNGSEADRAREGAKWLRAKQGMPKPHHMTQRLLFAFSMFVALNYDPTFTMDLSRLLKSTIARSKTIKSLLLMSMSNIIVPLLCVLLLHLTSRY